MNEIKVLNKQELYVINLALENFIKSCEGVIRGRSAFTNPKMRDQWGMLKSISEHARAVVGESNNDLQTSGEQWILLTVLKLPPNDDNNIHQERNGGHAHQLANSASAREEPLPIDPGVGTRDATGAGGGAGAELHSQHDGQSGGSDEQLSAE